MGRCIITTSAVRDLAAEMGDMSVAEVKNLIALWQETAGRSMEDMPTAGALRSFAEGLRNGDVRDGGRALDTFAPQDRVMMAAAFTNDLSQAVDDVISATDNTLGERAADKLNLDDGNTYVADEDIAEAGRLNTLRERLHDPMARKDLLLGHTDRLLVETANVAVINGDTLSMAAEDDNMMGDAAVEATPLIRETEGVRVMAGGDIYAVMDNGVTLSPTFDPLSRTDPHDTYAGVTPLAKAAVTRAAAAEGMTPVAAYKEVSAALRGVTRADDVGMALDRMGDDRLARGIKEAMRNDPSGSVRAAIYNSFATRPSVGEMLMSKDMLARMRKAPELCRDDGMWYNPWLRRLSEDGHVRRGISVKEAPATPMEILEETFKVNTSGWAWHWAPDNTLVRFKARRDGDIDDYGLSGPAMTGYVEDLRSMMISDYARAKRGDTRPPLSRLTGTTFIGAMDSYAAVKDWTGMADYTRAVARQALDESFNEAIAIWKDMGFLDTTDGMFTHLPFKAGEDDIPSLDGSESRARHALRLFHARETVGRMAMEQIERFAPLPADHGVDMTAYDDGRGADRSEWAIRVSDKSLGMAPFIIRSATAHRDTRAMIGRWSDDMEGAYTAGKSDSMIPDTGARLITDGMPEYTTHAINGMRKKPSSESVKMAGLRRVMAETGLNTIYVGEGGVSIDNATSVKGVTDIIKGAIKDGKARVIKTPYSSMSVTDESYRLGVTGHNTTIDTIPLFGGLLMAGHDIATVSEKLYGLMTERMDATRDMALDPFTLAADITDISADSDVAASVTITGDGPVIPFGDPAGYRTREAALAAVKASLAMPVVSGGTLRVMPGGVMATPPSVTVMDGATVTEAYTPAPFEVTLDDSNRKAIGVIEDNGVTTYVKLWIKGWLTDGDRSSVILPASQVNKGSGVMRVAFTVDDSADADAITALWDAMPSDITTSRPAMARAWTRAAGETAVDPKLPSPAVTARAVMDKVNGENVASWARDAAALARQTPLPHVIDNMGVRHIDAASSFLDGLAEAVTARPAVARMLGINETTAPAALALARTKASAEDIKRLLTSPDVRDAVKRHEASRQDTLTETVSTLISERELEGKNTHDLTTFKAATEKGVTFMALAQVAGTEARASWHDTTLDDITAAVINKREALNASAIIVHETPMLDIIAETLEPLTPNLSEGAITTAGVIMNIAGWGMMTPARAASVASDMGIYALSGSVRMTTATAETPARARMALTGDVAGKAYAKLSGKYGDTYLFKHLTTDTIGTHTVLRAVGDPDTRQMAYDWDTIMGDGEMAGEAADMALAALMTGDETLAASLPVSVKRAIPGYVTAARTALSMPLHDTRMAWQYVANHLPDTSSLARDTEKTALHGDITNIPVTRDMPSILTDGDSAGRSWYARDDMAEGDGRVTYGKITPLGLGGRVMEYEAALDLGETVTAFDDHHDTRPTARREDKAFKDPATDLIDIARRGEKGIIDDNGAGRAKMSEIGEDKGFRDAEGKPIC